MIFLLKNFFFSLKEEKSFFFGSFPLLYQILFFYLPIVIMVSSSFCELSHFHKIEKVTLSHFTLLFSKPYFVIILRSLLLASGSAIASLFLAYPIAYFLAFRIKKYKILLLLLLILPFWMNILLHMYAWISILGQGGLLNHFFQILGIIEEPIHFLHSPFSILLMMVYYYFPFMVFPLFSTFVQCDYHLLEASHDLGASAKQTFIHITLPLALPAVRVGFFLIFISSFGEFIIPELMGGDTYCFVGNVISEYILGDETAGIGTAFAILSFLFLGVGATIFLLLFHLLSKILSKRKTFDLRAENCLQREKKITREEVKV